MRLHSALLLLLLLYSPGNYTRARFFTSSRGLRLITLGMKTRGEEMNECSHGGDVRVSEFVVAAGGTMTVGLNKLGGYE